MCPIFKSSDPSTVSNYHPISLLCTVSKVLERLVFKHLLNHFRDNQILSPFQPAFSPGDFTANQLPTFTTLFMKRLMLARKLGRFCDISKALDRVWHAGLLHKLHSVCVHGSVLQ